MALSTKISTKRTPNTNYTDLQHGTVYTFPNTTLTYRQDNYSVFMSLDAGHSINQQIRGYNWVARLQRYSGGKWNTIGTRSGWVTAQSPSHRQWDNIAVRGASMRIVYELKPMIYTQGVIFPFNAKSKTYYTFPWVR